MLVLFSLRREGLLAVGRAMTMSQSERPVCPTCGQPCDLPPDLCRVLRDQSIIVPQDAAVFELMEKWRNAPSNTASAD